MISFGMRLSDMKRWFFDRDLVIRAVDKTTHRALNHFGASVRITARRSMRKRPGPSAPGTPPHRHGNPLIYNLMAYAFDVVHRSTVIGPTLLKGGWSPYGDTTIPQVNEYGGIVMRRDGRIYNYPARPFMQPAFEKGQDRLDKFWADAIRR